MAKKTKADTKVILPILAMLLIGVAYYQFVYVPQTNKIEELKQQKDNLKIQLENIENRVNTLAQLETKLEEEKSKIYPMAKKYFGNIDQEELILLIHDLGKKSTLDISEVSFKEAETEEDFGFVKVEPPLVDPDTNSENTNSESQKQQGEQTPEQKAPEAPPEQTGDTAEAEDKYKNLKMTNVDIKFFGTYKDLTELLKLIEENAENIVSNKLSIKKADEAVEGYNSYGKNPNDFIDGNFNLQFFKVISLEEYMPQKKSIFETQPFPKSSFESPIIGYSWAVPINNSSSSSSSSTSALGGSTSQVIKNTSTIIQNSETQGQIPQSSKSNVTPKQVMQYKQPVEIVRLDSLKGFAFSSEDEQNSGTISMDGVDDIKYKIIRTDLEFSKESPLDKRMFVNMNEKDIKIKEKPNSMTISVYSPKNTGYEIGFVFKDADGQTVFVPLPEKASFMGWKTMETNVDNVKFPASLDAIYVKRSSDEDVINGSIYLDTIHANYIKTK